MSVWNRFTVLIQFLIPQHFLSGLMFRAARCTVTPWKNTLIRIFIKLFHVDMTIAEKDDPRSYRHFNEFFTRSLKPDARAPAIEPDGIISPVDGYLSQIGRMENNQLIQAKGLQYTLEELTQENREGLTGFEDGEYITIYLSPRDYHRIHMPVTGKLIKMRYIPGSLFSVNTATTNTVNRLFARNERVVCWFDTKFGKMALIMVGAIFVGSMETVWAGSITPANSRQPRVWHYPDNEPAISLTQGQEMGRFNMGSTVILLFQAGSMAWLEDMRPDNWIAMGQKIGFKIRSL